MSQSTSSEAVMTRLNPHGHHIAVTSSKTWEWVVAKQVRCQPSYKARVRQSWLEWHESHGCNVTRTCERFAISRPTFYRWYHRFKASGVAGIEDRSHRPK